MNYVPKHLIQIGDKPLLQHVIDTWQGLVDNFVFVLKPSATYLWEYLPGNSIVVFQDEPKGLADAILRAEPCMSGKFIVTLGDCLYRGDFEDEDFEKGTSGPFELGIGVWKTRDTEEAEKSYRVYTVNGRIVRVAEKPHVHPSSTPCNCGMGVYFLDNRVFDYIRKTSLVAGGGDFTAVLQAMIDADEEIQPIWFEGKYINVTYPSDLEKAEEVLR